MADEEATKLLYTKRAIMFVDMAKGGHLQTYRIYCDGQTSPIFETAIKKDRDHPWVVTISFDADGNGGKFPSIRAAIEAWEAAGKPGLGGE